MKHFFKERRKYGFMIAVVCLLCLSLPIYARTLVDIEKECRISVQYHVENTEFHLYKVADVTKTYGFPVTEEFASYEIDFDALNSEQWKNMAETLAGYVERDALEPIDMGTTDEQGCVNFENISVGVYLVVGKQVKDDNYIYRCKPFLAFVPLEMEDGTWNYEPEFSPKPSEDPIELIDLSAIKVWKDEGREDSRPKQIIVQLLKNGEIVDEIALNPENNWRFIWQDLSSEFTWQAVEKEVPEGYTVESIKEGNVLQIINTKEGEPEKPTVLPQTGQLWWPVPVLAFVGLLFLVLGFAGRKGNER
ncbi:MAG: Cna B-type domain-containing protein [Lachnospiraceae bacterium]|nr:Cna B-type domain-containing protein [Lachnospiraceae bacterium]